MSIPQIFLTASGSSMPTTTTNVSTSRRMPSLDSSSNSKEHIRERLNLHVKKRIQGHDIGHYSMPSASPSPPTSLYSATNAHPFLMTGTAKPNISISMFNFFAQFPRQTILKPVLTSAYLELICRCISFNAIGYGICQFTHNRCIKLWQRCWTNDSNATNWTSITENETTTKKSNKEKERCRHEEENKTHGHKSTARKFNIKWKIFRRQQRLSWQKW